jgi:hypothetical protein
VDNGTANLSAGFEPVWVARVYVVRSIPISSLKKVAKSSHVQKGISMLPVRRSPPLSAVVNHAPLRLGRT